MNLTQINLNQTIRAALEADKKGVQYPIDFDHVWRELGYTQRNRAGRCVMASLQRDIDYQLLLDMDAIKGRKGREAPLNKIRLTLKGFETLAKLTKTKAGVKATASFTRLQNELRKAYIEAFISAYRL